METDKLIVGWLVGVTDAGLYFMTQRVGVLPTQELLSPLQRILFPAFSELADDTPRLRRAVCESINVLASLSLPAGFGFALIAADFVPLALGRQWSPIVPLLVVLVPYLGLRSTLSMTLPCVLALGRTRLLFWVSAVYALVHVPAFVAGTALFGLPGSIWSIVAAGVLYSYLNAWMLAMLEISLGEVMRQLRRPLAATAFMIAAVAGLAAVTPLDALGGQRVRRGAGGQDPRGRGGVPRRRCTRSGGSRAGPQASNGVSLSCGPVDLPAREPSRRVLRKPTRSARQSTARCGGRPRPGRLPPDAAGGRRLRTGGPGPGTAPPAILAARAGRSRRRRSTSATRPREWPPRGGPRQGQEQHPRLADVPIGQHEHVGGGEVRGHLGERDVAEPVDRAHARRRGEQRVAPRGIEPDGITRHDEPRPGSRPRDRRPRVEQHVESLVFTDVAEEERDLVARIEAQLSSRRLPFDRFRAVPEEPVLAVGNHVHAPGIDRELLDQALAGRTRSGR